MTGCRAAGTCAGALSSALGMRLALVIMLSRTGLIFINSLGLQAGPCQRALKTLCRLCLASVLCYLRFQTSSAVPSSWFSAQELIPLTQAAGW